MRAIIRQGIIDKSACNSRNPESVTENFFGIREFSGIREVFFLEKRQQTIEMQAKYF
jgi:hypothetical protein